MTRTTHTTVGICSSYYLSVSMGVNPVLPVVVGVFSSLLPDIDTGKSTINKLLIRIKLFQGKSMKVYFLGLFALLLLAYKLTANSIVALLCILSLLLVIGEHRTWFHSAFMLLPYNIILSSLEFSSFLMAIGTINYAMHLVLDMLNPSGVMLLFPISRKVHRFPITFRTSSEVTRLLEYTADATIIYFTFRDSINFIM